MGAVNRIIIHPIKEWIIYHTTFYSDSFSHSFFLKNILISIKTVLNANCPSCIVSMPGASEFWYNWAIKISSHFSNYHFLTIVVTVKSYFDENFIYDMCNFLKSKQQLLVNIIVDQKQASKLKRNRKKMIPCLWNYKVKQE